MAAAAAAMHRMKRVANMTIFTQRIRAALRQKPLKSDPGPSAEHFEERSYDSCML